LKVYALVIEKPHSGEYEIDGLIKNNELKVSKTGNGKLLKKNKI
jgi:hypothetical protein